MRKVTVNRPQKIQFVFTKGKVHLDGSECAVVKAGGTATFEVPDGDHQVQVKFASIPPVDSNVVLVEAGDGDVNIEVKIIVPLKSGPTQVELTKK